KKAELIEEKSDSKRCLQCSKNEHCEEFSTIGYPLLTQDKKALGVIGLIAFNEKQKEYIYSHKEEIGVFLEKLSLLLAGNLNYETTINNLSLRNEEFLNIVNSIDYGIILTDKNLEIKNVNRRVLNLLGLKKEDLLGKNIKNIFDNFKTDITQGVYSLADRKLGDGNEFIVKTIKNLLDDEVESYIFQISNYSKALINAYNIIGDQNNIDFEHILGNSESIKNTVTLAKQISAGDSSVMIRGESGTGKELFARAIHRNSKRKHNPYIAINCAAIPDNLLESELFGYEEGAFTGARSSGKVGRLELANGGTLFLDEIGDLPLSLQPKLLRVLQDGNFVRLGGKKPINTNFRLITATNRDLEEMVRTEQFREDLYYRLNVIPINIPPLRKRKEDIGIIAQAKLEEYCIRLSKDHKVFSDELLKTFEDFPWKGNVRELENIIEYLVNVSHGDVITSEQLPPSFNEKSGELKTTKEINSIDLKNKTLQQMTDEFEREVLLNLITLYGDDTKAKKKIADKLNINLSTLYRKLYRYNIN
ncbi:MAG: sigma 54-interacting transcriptional regulator, partial [Peptoniphilus sp.]|nr:sigma 54-interacting transcriptional regulator [Peptoniphilus sp.]